jgi:hypothetical protein
MPSPVSGLRSPVSLKVLYWIDVMVELGLIPSGRVEELRGEADEIIAITVSSIKTARRGARR